MEKGKALLDENNYEESMNCFFEAMMKNPKSVMALIGIAVILEKENKLEKAIGCYRKFIQISP